VIPFLSNGDAREPARQAAHARPKPLRRLGRTAAAGLGVMGSACLPSRVERS
jgi:hypothetical protein